MPSVVIPAHNEAAVIGRLLRALCPNGASAAEILVVANGCDDDTVAVVERFAPAVRVVSTPEPSKFRAMRLGDEHVRSFPRLYVDADVIIDAGSVAALASALVRPGVLAAAPRRLLDTAGASWIVRWYYDIWSLLPTVLSGLYGRGVIALGEAGYARLRESPEVMADDLAASVAFGPSETVVVDAATVTVRVPRTVQDLIRRRVRAVTSIAQLHSHAPDAVDAGRTTKADLVGIVRSHPLLIGKLAVFLAVTVVARRRARAAVARGDFHTWLRDESSRDIPTNLDISSEVAMPAGAGSTARPTEGRPMR